MELICSDASRPIDFLIGVLGGQPDMVIPWAIIVLPNGIGKPNKGRDHYSSRRHTLSCCVITEKTRCLPYSSQERDYTHGNEIWFTRSAGVAYGPGWNIRPGRSLRNHDTRRTGSRSARF